VVLVSGSGPQDRDESIAGHRPFLVLADHLARRGIASLRYDDRGTALSTGNFAASTTADNASDALAAVRFLRGQPGISTDRIGIVGHSEGAQIATMVGARQPEVAFIVMLAGAGLPGDSILILQTRAIMAAGGTPRDQIDRQTRLRHAIFSAIKSSADSAEGVARAVAAAREVVASFPVSVRDDANAMTTGLINSLGAPWMSYFIRNDPREDLRRLRIPVLALIGGLDLQVPPSENIGAIE
jgi:pimeloyl-ACP methyl ester carboxylesterase